jgi:tetratricopeptide (TPR) repeat protein
MNGGTVPSVTQVCESCGAGVPDRKDLRRVRQAGRTRRVCPTCAMRIARAGRGRRTMTYVVVVVLTLALLVAVDPVLTWADAGLILAVLAGSIALHVAAHEAAHALVALALGMGVPQVQLGEGPVLLRLRLGRTTVELRGFHSGATHIEPSGPGLLRVRLALVTAAGPLANLALAAAAYWLFDPSSRAAASFAWNVSAVGLFVGLVNLVPLKVRSGQGIVRSDGGALLALLLANRSASDQILAASRLQAAHRQHLAGGVVPAADERPIDCADAVTLGMEGTRRILTREYADAIALLREAVSLPQKDHPRSLSLNNLAWALLLARPDGWLEEADRASVDAIALTPWLEPLMGTRGCVLVHLDGLTEARDLLRRAVQADAAPQDLVVLHSHLLRAEHGLGNLYGARASLIALIDNGAEPHEVESARALLRTAEVDNALTNLVDADGRARWPDARLGGADAQHVREMQHALAAFLDRAGEDPRREAVRTALGY